MCQISAHYICSPPIKEGKPPHFGFSKIILAYYHAFDKPYVFCAEFRHHFVQILSFFSNPIFFFIFQILSPRLNAYDKHVDWIDLTIEIPFEERDRRFYIKYKKYAYKYRTNIRRLFYTLYPLISRHIPGLCSGKFLE